MVFRFHMKSAGFHEIRMKSGGFHVKSTQNLIKASVSANTLQFDECRVGGYDQGFHEILGHTPSPAPPPQTKEFLLKHFDL